MFWRESCRSTALSRPLIDLRLSHKVTFMPAQWFHLKSTQLATDSSAVSQQLLCSSSCMCWLCSLFVSRYKTLIMNGRHAYKSKIYKKIKGWKLTPYLTSEQGFRHSYCAALGSADVPAVISSSDGSYYVV